MPKFERVPNFCDEGGLHFAGILSGTGDEILLVGLKHGLSWFEWKNGIYEELPTIL